MNAHRAETIVNPDGSLLLENVPFQPGDQVEVIVIERVARVPSDNANPYPLRGQVVRYDAPFEAVAEEDWGVMQ